MTNAESNWSSRKLGAESSATRAALVVAAQRLILEEGYAAVTSRRVASVAGLKPQLVHYYFRSMDDLLLEVLQYSAEQAVTRITSLLETHQQPLRALWEFHSDPRSVSFTSEFHALAGRNAVVRAELARFGERFRTLQTEALAKHLDMRGVKARIPPVLVSVLLVSLANVLVRERELGMTIGHAEAAALVEACLTQFAETGDVSMAAFLSA
jgi:AcrR family transcriptional regulator